MLILLGSSTLKKGEQLKNTMLSMSMHGKINISKHLDFYLLVQFQKKLRITHTVE